MREEKRRVCISLPLRMYCELEQLAERTKRPLPAYIRQILRRYLEKRGSAVEPSEVFARLEGREQGEVHTP